MPATDTQLDAIPGWFESTDRDLFRIMLSASRDITGPGNLAEVGVFMGQSAALIGDYLASGETLTVIDLFGSPAQDAANSHEQDSQYDGLTRAAFEANYLRVHPSLPRVVQGFSDEINDHVDDASCRFVHIDASHLYEHVSKDIVCADQLLMTDGLVVFDDYRSGHTPGVAAAVWAEVGRGRLKPVVLSPNKMYATWGDPAPWREAVSGSGKLFASEVQHIAGNDVVLVFPPEAKPYRWVKYLPPAAVPVAKRARAGIATLVNRERASR